MNIKNNIDIMNILYNILEDRIDSNKSENYFHKKFLEIEKIDNSEINLSDEINIYINEEYSIINLYLMIDDKNDLFKIMILDNEESSEDELIYIEISSINLDLYEYNFKKIKNIIIQIINDFLEIHYDNIKI